MLLQVYNIIKSIEKLNAIHKIACINYYKYVNNFTKVFIYCYVRRIYMYNNKIFIMIMAGSMTMGLLN